MNTNTIRIAVKSILKNIRTHFINILGMTLALAVAIFITIYNTGQLNYDRNQSNYDSIYRLELGSWANLSGGIIPWIADNFPEVESYIRIATTFRQSTLEYENSYYTIDNLLFIDGQPFDVFDFEFVLGDQESALVDPNSIVLTESVAKNMFGNKNPIGKIINYQKDNPFRVSAVIKDVDNLHLTVEAMINFSRLKDITMGGNDSYMTELRGSQNYMAYYVLNSDNYHDLSQRIANKLVEMNVYSADNPPEYRFRPFSEIYFLGDDIREHSVVHGNMQLIMALAFVAIFVIIIASINFINLFIAKGISRSREIGMRKIAGSSRAQLVMQLLFEASFLIFVALVIAIIIILNLYHAFQYNLGIQLPDLNHIPVSVYLIAGAIFIITAAIAGLYPALVLSSWQPINVLRIDFRSSGRSRMLRRVLIWLQFSISIFMTFQALLIFKQYLSMKNADTGINMQNVISFEVPDYLTSRNEIFRKSLLEYPDIRAVSFSNQALGKIRYTRTFFIPRIDAAASFRVQMIDPEYFEVLKLNLFEGRQFDRERVADSYQYTIANEASARVLGFDPPESIIGYEFPVSDDFTMEVLGIVRDYHYNSLHEVIQPTFLVWEGGQKTVYLRYEGDSADAVIEHIGNVWQEFVGDRPLNYTFLDTTFGKYYESERKLSMLISIFSLLALLISCFGIFGISAFMARQSSSDICIRKIMGADIRSILVNFCQEYLWLILIAGLITLPLASIYGNQWLEKFPYKSDINIWLFVVPFILNLVIAIGTLSYHAYRSATLNPADTLRHE